MKPVLPLIAAAVLAACSPPPEEADPAPPAPAAGAPASPPEPASAAPLLNLAGEGLSLVDPATGSARQLMFGVPRAVAVQAVATRGPALESGRNEECGAGPLDFARFPGGLTLWFQDGRFAGWAMDREGAPDLATAAGLKIGSTRAELAAAYDARVSETSLGQEFEAGGISGVLGSAAPDARVEALWAGVSCVFR